MLVSNIFREQDAPEYILACVISCVFGAVSLVLTLAIGIYMKLDNRRRDKAQGIVMKPGDFATSELKPPFQKDINWRWMGGIK